MRLPEIADELRQLADKHGIPRLHELARQMARRRPISRAAPTSVPATDELRAAIRAYKVMHPGASQLAIGRVFNVNPGRVSEALRGFRK